MNIPIFKRNLVHTLFDDVEDNLEFYKTGNIGEILERQEYADSIRSLKDLYEPEKLQGLDFGLAVERDVENAILVHSELKQLTPALATDERIWTAICHTACPDFVWGRWVERIKTKDGQVKAIKKHYFAQMQGNRGITRNNAIASLWWIAHIATKNRPDIPADEAIRDFASLSDLRSAIMERPTMSRIPQVFGAIMDCYKKKIEQDSETQFFRRTTTGGQYRTWLKQINNMGGMSYFAVMNQKDLFKSFWDQLLAVEQNN